MLRNSRTVRDSEPPGLGGQPRTISLAGKNGDGRWQLWQGPKLRTDEEQGLDWKATWLELFYDLVLVVVLNWA